VLEVMQNGYEKLGANPIEAERTDLKYAKKKNCKLLFYI